MCTSVEQACPAAAKVSLLLPVLEMQRQTSFPAYCRSLSLSCTWLIVALIPSARLSNSSLCALRWRTTKTAACGRTSVSAAEQVGERADARAQQPAPQVPTRVPTRAPIPHPPSLLPVPHSPTPRPHSHWAHASSPPPRCYTPGCCSRPSVQSKRARWARDGGMT